MTRMLTVDRRSAIYCDRPRMVMVGEIMTKNLALPIARYDNRYVRISVTPIIINMHVVDEIVVVLLLYMEKLFD